jgi:hypothetical protein
MSASTLTHFIPEDGCSKFLQNLSACLQNYKASQCRRPQLEYSPLWNFKYLIWLPPSPIRDPCLIIHGAMQESCGLDRLFWHGKVYYSNPISLIISGELLFSFETWKYLFTHSWSWALLEKLPIVQPLKNFPAFYGTRRFLSFWPSHQYPICVPLLPHSCYMPCPSHPPWLDNSKKSTSYEAPHYVVFSTLPSLHLSSVQLFSSNTLSLCSSLNVRDQVSHPYRTTGKIIVLYILIFMFLDSRRRNTTFIQILCPSKLSLFPLWRSSLDNETSSRNVKSNTHVCSFHEYNSWWKLCWRITSGSL